MKLMTLSVKTYKISSFSDWVVGVTKVLKWSISFAEEGTPLRTTFGMTNQRKFARTDIEEVPAFSNCNKRKIK